VKKKRQGEKKCIKNLKRRKESFARGEVSTCLKRQPNTMKYSENGWGEGIGIVVPRGGGRDKPPSALREKEKDPPMGKANL